MKIEINNKEYEIPFDPSVIKLGDYIKYYNLYGKELGEKLQSVINEKDHDKKINLIDNITDEEAISWFSFWSGFDLTTAYDLPGLSDVFSSYRILKYLLQYNQEDCDFPLSVKWNGDIWKIQDFKVNPSSEMTFNEIITSKEVVTQLFSLGKGKIDSLLYLCIIFFRKDGEPYTDELIHENSERMILMSELPLRYAMNVSLFLKICADSLKKTSVYLEKEEVA